jgi:hypothetical protein
MSNKSWGPVSILEYIASPYAHDRGCARQARIISLDGPDW